MLSTKVVRGKYAHLFALLVFSLLILGLVPALAGQGQGNGNGKDNSAIQSGYAIITPDPPTAGLVVFETFGERRGQEMTQAGVLATGASEHWVLFTNTNGKLSRNLGVAVANPGSAAVAQIILSLRDPSGNPVGLPESFDVPTGSQVSKYVTELFADQEDLALQDFTGTLDISSNNPVGVVGLRFRGANFSTIPATFAGSTENVPNRGPAGGPGAVILPQFATGGGWASEIVIVNPTDSDFVVRVDLFDQEGNGLTATLNGTPASSFTDIMIKAHGVYVLSPGDDF